MEIWMILFTLALYLVLTPNLVFRSLPPKGSLLKVALVHGIVFTLIHHFVAKHFQFIYETRQSPANKAALSDEQQQRLSLLYQNRQQGI